MDTVQAIAVIGAGTMGRGIAHVFALAGHEVRLFDVDEGALSDAHPRIADDLDRAIRAGALEETKREETLGRIETSTDLADAVSGCRFVIESVPESEAIKRTTFGELDRLTEPTTILASNTSAMSITAIASWTKKPERVVGVHFFNPAHRMKLVEVIQGLGTDSGVVQAARALCEAAGKETVVVADQPGFATSRISALVGNEAFHMLMEGVASAEDIDKAVKLALGYPMGPFELGDLVGLDTRLSVLRHLHETLGERFRPSPLLVKYVEAGYLGRKTGRGVYRYPPETGHP
jgi:3-hydroxybutyryl-CoA dehydrogenase